MAVMQEYKCPCCGGAIGFDSTIQKLKCPYCDTEFEMEALQNYNEDLMEEAPDEMQWDIAEKELWGDQEMGVFVCNSCGGELIADQNTAATACPYCGNPIVLTKRLTGEWKPDLVIPFRLDKKAAIAGLRKHLQGKKLLPKAFKDENHIQEIKGVYVPFWLFDAEADAKIRYRTTRTRFWSDSNYNYTETSYYSVMRGGGISFSAVPVDGSTKMADDLMESIEPFDLQDAVDFQSAYLAGYFADKYDVDAQSSIARAKERIQESTEQQFAATVKGYDTVQTEQSSIHLKTGRTKYALYPVWLLNTKWNDEQYIFAMNGQTGKFVGNLPLDKSAFRRYFLSIAGGCAAALFAIQFLLWML